MPLSQLVNDLKLRHICILIFVYHDILEDIAILIAQRFVALEQSCRIEQDIVKIHGFIHQKRLLILMIDVDHSALIYAQFLLFGTDLLRQDKSIFIAADAAKHTTEGIVLLLITFFFVYLSEDGALFIIAIDAEICPKWMIIFFKAEYPKADRVEGSHPERACIDIEQAFQALTKFPRRFIGEGDYEYFPRRHLLFFDEICHSVDDAARLAAPCPRQDEYGMLGIHHHLTLGGV